MNHWYSRVLEPLLRGPNENLIEFSRTKGVLKRYVKCISCQQDMETRPYSRNRDGVAFRCINYSKYISIRIESLLSSFNVPLSSILQICYKWFNNQTQVQIGSEVNVGRKIIMKIIDLLRSQCLKYAIENLLRLGGDSMVVQIDESLFRHKQKYQCGRQPEREIWVFGLADVSFTQLKSHFMLFSKGQLSRFYQ
ncbi:hypothetical protein HERIO_2260 [Hepatospora eriocheir]|uniref:ISXO2-like transposase domain-containing protein n=1 Tax=Hepatospora eriocheir TaxID=1081669 RepID=A0A1X0Q7J3_9MICR|nr:hypothetical protein HERIO_2260 [Hepatospora eriocheir]